MAQSIQKSDLSGNGEGPGVMETFFHGSDTQFGIFYPKNYLVAIFPGLAEVILAQRTLRDAGFAEDEVLAVAGDDVVHYAREHLQKEGLAKLLMSEVMGEVSRLIGTEAIYADQDLEMANQGWAFLAAYAPTERKKREAWALIEPLDPFVARHYSIGGIEVLRGAGADHAHAA